MSAVLSVLGTVLIVLLKIILVLLLLLCILLVCPICYKGTVDYHGTLTAGGRIIWLFGLLYVSFVYRDGARESHIRLLGVDVQKVMAGRAERKRRKAAKQKRGQKRGSTNEGDKKEETVIRQQEALRIEEEAFMRQQETLHIGEKEEMQDLSEEDNLKQELQEISEEKDSFWRRWSFGNLKERVLSFLRSIQQFFTSIRSIFQKIRKKMEWAGEAKLFWYSENTQRMVCILKDNVLHLWRKLKPKVLRGNIIFGAGDPCLTGQILGVAAVFYASCGRGIQVMPDFEDKRLEGNLLVKGRISLITIVMILIRIFLRGEWSRFRREAEQLKEAL